MTYTEICAEKVQTPQGATLVERLQDLEGRLQELLEHLPNSYMSENYDRRFCSSLANCEIDHATASSLQTVEDVLTAISRTKDKLWNIECEFRRVQRAEEPLNMEVPGQVIIIGFADVLCEEAAKLAS